MKISQAFKRSKNWTANDNDGNVLATNPRATSFLKNYQSKSGICRKPPGTGTPSDTPDPMSPNPMPPVAGTPDPIAPVVDTPVAGMPKPMPPVAGTPDPMTPVVDTPVAGMPKPMPPVAGTPDPMTPVVDTPVAGMPKPMPPVAGTPDPIAPVVDTPVAGMPKPMPPVAGTPDPIAPVVDTPVAGMPKPMPPVAGTPNPTQPPQSPISTPELSPEIKAITDKNASFIALDTDTDGLGTIGIDGGVQFDIFNNGTPTNVGWISPDDAILTLDVNGNGTIDNGSELFGGGIGKGFAQLGTFDSNGDKVIDAKDADFGKLSSWQDGNSNGITDAGELRSLADAGVTSIDLNTENSFTMDGNNVIGETTKATSDNGPFDVASVYFAAESAGTPDPMTPVDGTPDAGTPDPMKPVDGTPVAGVPDPMKPVDGTPVAGVPDPMKPVDGTPVAGVPDPMKPVDGTPVAGVPDPMKPVDGTPVAGVPDPMKPVDGTPVAGVPDPMKPVDGTPDAGTPDPMKPVDGTPDAGTPDPMKPVDGTPVAGVPTAPHDPTQTPQPTTPTTAPELSPEVKAITDKNASVIGVDSDGDGIGTIGIDAGIKFDIFNTGTPVNVGWIGGNDSLLSLDANGNGTIDNGAEIFGGGVGQGFAKLGTFDSNGDKLIDAKDTDFSKLSVWNDANSNAITDPGELLSLANAGITSIDLNTKNTFTLASDSNNSVLGETTTAASNNGPLDVVGVYFPS
jgi:hypothetical protein